MINYEQYFWWFALCSPVISLAGVHADLHPIIAGISIAFTATIIRWFFWDDLTDPTLEKIGDICGVTAMFGLLLVFFPLVIWLELHGLSQKLIGSAIWLCGLGLMVILACDNTETNN